MRDAILEAQDTIAHRTDQTEQDPKESGGGEVISKALRLESEVPMLYSLLIVLALGLVFGLGFYIGQMTEHKKVLESRVDKLESALIEHRFSPELAQKQATTAAPTSTTKRAPASSVMKYHNPKDIRKEKEALALAAINKEIESLGKSGGMFDL